MAHMALHLSQQQVPSSFPAQPTHTVQCSQKGQGRQANETQANGVKGAGVNPFKLTKGTRAHSHILLTGLLWILQAGRRGENKGVLSV